MLKKDYEGAFALVAENLSVTDEVVYSMLHKAYLLYVSNADAWGETAG